MEELLGQRLTRMYRKEISLIFFRSWYNTSNTRKNVSSDIQTLRSVLKKQGATEFFFNQIRSVWKSDETLFREFDVASQSIDNS